MIQEHFDRFLSHMEEHKKSPQSIKSYRSTFKSYAASYNRIEDSCVKCFLSKYENEATRNKVLGHLRSFSSWCNRQPELRGKLVGSFTLEQRRLDLGLPEILSQEQVIELLRALGVECPYAWLHATIMSETGLRAGEVFGLSQESFRLLDSKPFLQFVGKGRKCRIVPLTSKALEAFNLFTSSPRLSSEKVYQAYRRASKNAALPGGFAPHWLRHTWASTMRARGCSYDQLADMLGNGVEVCRSRYARVDSTSMHKLVQGGSYD